jgi:protein tyrosine/serine phosphatase
MSERIIQSETLTAIANAIRAKNSSSDTYTPSQMADAIIAIPTSSGGESVWFDDRNDSVRAYLTGSEVYTAANRSSTSVIGNYASTSIQDQDCPKPFLGTYNLDPNEDNRVDDWTVTRFDYPPRMMKMDGVWNVRDCGGWDADNGKMKYGYLFRGARLNGASANDLTALATAGIKFELDIRDAANAAGTVATIPGSTYRNVAINNAYAQMITGEATAAATACIAAMESIVDDKPVYIHCASGADRTGCICAMLEALLGVADTDIDRDFEMTNFADIEDLTGHNRNGGSWTGFWSALNSGQSNAKMNVAKFLRNNGATTSLLNSFREKMIDGNPSSIDIPTYTITNNLSGCSTNNSATSVDGGVSYSATITPNSGYTIKTLTVTMGGTDITSTAVSENSITIANVTGAIVITAVAEGNFTNLVHQSQEVSSTAIYNGGLGYKNGYYISGGNESANANDCMTGCIPYVIGSTQPTDVIYIKGYTGGVGESHTRLCIRKSDKTRISEFNGFLNANNIFDVTTLGTGYYKLTPKTGIHNSYTVGYVQFSFHQPDASGIIITKNEPIE